MEGEPFFLITYDYDANCGRAIGSHLSVWIVYRSGQFRLTCGEPKSFSKMPGVTRTFCADCGTSIGYVDDGLAGEIYLTVRFLDTPREI